MGVRDFEILTKEMRDAGADQWTSLLVLRGLEEHKDVSLNDLREKVITLLEKYDAKAAESYKNFFRLRVLTSGEKMERFNKEKIVNSLLKETDINKITAQKIASDVEEEVKKLSLDYIDTSLIREMVDIKLVEYGHKNIRDQYARVGFPVKDIGKTNKEILENVINDWMKRVLDIGVLIGHYERDYYIMDLDYFNIKRFGVVKTYEDVFDVVDEHETKNLTIENINESLFNRREDVRNLFRIAKRTEENFDSINIVINLYSQDSKKKKKEITSFAKDIINEFRFWKEELKKTRMFVKVDSKELIDGLDKKKLFSGLSFINSLEDDFYILNDFIGRKSRITSCVALNLVKIVFENEYNLLKIKNKIEEVLNKIKYVFEEKQKFFKENVFRNSGLVLHGYGIVKNEIEVEEIKRSLSGWNVLYGDVEVLRKYNKEAFGISRRDDIFRKKVKKVEEVGESFRDGNVVVELG